jgi:glycosyltransferase involved in cell wall biosynthesis
VTKYAPKVVLFANTSSAMLQFRGALIKKLVAKAVTVVVLAQPDGVSEHHLMALGAEFEPVTLSRSGTSLRQELVTLRMIFSILWRVRPDVLVSYTIKPNTYALPICRLLNIRSIGVVTGLGYAFLNDGIIAKLARFGLRASLRLADHIWFLNGGDLNEVCGSSRALKRKSTLLRGEGIDTSHYVATPYPDGPIRFLMIARLLVDKGIREFVTAAHKIAKTHKDVAFDILGPFDPANPSAIKESELAVAVEFPYINYLGVADDVRSAIGAAHCVVLPSYREGLPLVLLEGGAMGRPLIASDVEGCRDVVVSGVTGFLCEPKSADALSECMEKFISLNEVAREAMAKAARADIVERFDESLVLLQYIQKFGDLGVEFPK